jgi:hypothetical protein
MLWKQFARLSASHVTNGAKLDDRLNEVLLYMLQKKWSHNARRASEINLFTWLLLHVWDVNEKILLVAFCNCLIRR